MQIVARRTYFLIEHEGPLILDAQESLEYNCLLIHEHHRSDSEMP